MSDGSSSMYDLLRSEIETNAASLTDGLLNLERASASPQTIEPLMRAAHSIKGAARIVGLDAAVKVAHALEDFLVAAQAGTAALDSAKVDVLLKGVDLLKKISASADPATFALPESETQEAQCMAAAIGALGREPEIPRLILIDPPLESDEKPAAKTQAPAPAPSAPAKPKAAPRPAPTEAERIVRVNAAGMDHILGLSGELFVQSGRLEVLVLDLGRLKSAADETASLLEGAFQAAHAGDIPRAVEVLQRAKQRHERCARLLGAHRADLDAARRRILGTSGRLYQEAQSSKMCPFADCAQGFPRMVRDISRSLGKVAKLEFSGMNAGVDRDILEKLESPLTHLLRNALDHGIESPEQRINSGKQMEGVITMDAWHAAGMLVVEIADDGAGVDMARLKETIVAKKLTTAELVAKMSDFEILDFIFLPGFSTRENVTEFSGRGIGLDIVQGMIRDVGGTLRMESRPGHGTRFRLRLPLTLSVIKALIVEISGELYALPLSRASRCWRASRQKVVRVDGVRHLETDEGRFKLVAASEILDLQPAVEGACVSAVGIGEPPERYALEVDRLLGERPIAVRPLDPRLGKIRDISAAAVLDDGSPILVLDADDLVRSAQLCVPVSGPARSAGSGGKQDHRLKRLLVVDDSPTVREVERKILESHGYQVDMSINGMDAWNAVRSAPYDAVISDVDMPRMNGLELARRIKGEPRLKGLPIIIVSYKDSPADRAEGLRAGASLYLSKGSFQDDTLLRAVKELLGGESE